MNDKYFKNRIENSPLGSAGLKLLNAQEKLISQEYEIELLRIIAAQYKAFFFIIGIWGRNYKNNEKRIKMQLLENLMDSVGQVEELLQYLERLKICMMKV